MKNKEVINIDFDNLDSINRAEKKKAKLEKEGYTLVKEVAGLFKSSLHYVKKKESPLKLFYCNHKMESHFSNPGMRFMVSEMADYTASKRYDSQWNAPPVFFYV